MSAFQKLSALKDQMMKPIYEKRRHLGCDICGTTFYGYYQKTGIYAVPNGKEKPHPTKSGWTILETYDDVFYPECPSCLIHSCVTDAKEAKRIYLKRQEEQRKKAERRAAKQEKRNATPVNCGRRLFFERRDTFEKRLKEVWESPEKIKPVELLSTDFLDELFITQSGLGKRSKMFAHYKVKKLFIDDTYMSNSGKTRMGWFTPYFVVENTKTGKVRKHGTEYRVKPHKNRRNDPDRNWGLPE